MTAAEGHVQYSVLHVVIDVRRMFTVRNDEFPITIY